MLAVSGVLLVAFFLVESRVEAPLLPLRMLRMRPVAGANAVGFLLGASFFGFIFVGTLYMQQVLGYSALKAGLAWLAASLTSVALAGLSQLLVTRISAAPVMAAGMAMIAGGILWATQAPVHGMFWADLAGAFFVAGAGTAFGFIPISIAGLTGVTERDAGARVRAAQHLAAARRRAGCRGRVHRRGESRRHVGRRRRAAGRRADRRVSVGVLGVHDRRRGGHPGQLHRPAPGRAGTGTGGGGRRRAASRQPSIRIRRRHAVNRVAVRCMVKPDHAARNKELGRNVHRPSPHT